MTKEEHLERACQVFAEELADYFRPEWKEAIQLLGPDEPGYQDTLSEYIKTFLAPAPEEWILGKVVSYLPKD